MLQRDTEELRGPKHRGSLLEREGYGRCILDVTSARRREILRCLGFGRDVRVHAATVERRNLTGKCSRRPTQRVIRLSQRRRVLDGQASAGRVNVRRRPSS